MGVVAFGAVRSAGVTTTIAAVAATWPSSRRVLMVEADPSGGTLAACFGLPTEPGLVSLAAAGRRRVEPGLVWAHTQPAPHEGALLLAGPVAAEQARAALDMTGDLLAGLGRLDADVLVDCGRLDPTSPAVPLFTAADLAVLVARPQLPDLQHLADWLQRHRPAAAELGTVLVGPAGFAAADIAETLGVPVWGQLPHDPAGVAALSSGPSRGLSRSPVTRHARSLAETLTARLPLSAVAEPLDGVGGGALDATRHDAPADPVQAATGGAEEQPVAADQHRAAATR